MTFFNKKNSTIVVILGVLIIITMLVLVKKRDMLILHGKISPYYTYTLRTVYESNSILPFCRTISLFNSSGLTSKNKFFDYSPKVTMNKHFISIPLEYGGLNICHYKLKKIDLRYPSRNDTLFKNGATLDYVGYNIRAIDVYRTTQLLPELIAKKENDYTIDFYSNEDSSAYHVKKLNIEKVEKKIAWQKRQSIKKEQRIEEAKLAIPYKKAKADIKLLSKVFIMYRKLYYEVPDESTGNRLLQLKDLNLLSKAKDFKPTMQRLKKEIIFKNGNLVDPWGEPYRYMPKHKPSCGRYDVAHIYSYGPKLRAGKNKIFSSSLVL